MQAHYKHTQVGYVVLGALGIGAVVLAVLFLRSQEAPRITAAVILTLLVSMVLFASLTVEIREGFLRWRFGPGLIRKQVRLAEIERTQAVRNRWYYGWGIRLTPHGWLYNVSGLEAVKVQLHTGKKFRLGTDEPEELVRALQAAIG